MKMSEFEILRDYHQAKDKVEQVKILADMNLCTMKEMTSFLEKHGIIVQKCDTKFDTRLSVESMYNQGMTDEEIADKIGLKPSSVATIRIRLGLKKHKKRKPVGADFLKSSS